MPEAPAAAQGGGRRGRREQRLVHPVVPAGRAVPHLDNGVGHAADQMPVVGDQHHRARVGDERVLQHVAARQVEVVRRLVQHQQVDRVGHHLGQGQSGLLTAGEVADQAVAGLAAEAERPQHGAQVASRPLADLRLHLLDHGAGHVELLGQVLREGGDVHVGATGQLPGAGRQLTQQEADQRGLARAVRADQRHLAAPLDDQVDAREDRAVVVVAGDDTRQLGHHPGRALRLGEGEAGHQLLAVGRLDPLDAVQGLEPALHLTGLGGLVAEALHEPLDVGDLAGLAAGGRLELGDPLLPGHDELGEPADVLDERPPAQLQHMGGDGVDEVAVVADEQQGAAPAHQVLLEPGDRVDVEVVGGLVEDQQVGLGDQQCGQRHPHPPTARTAP